MDLFGNEEIKDSEGFTPLSERMRPGNLDEFVGQEHIVGQGKPLRVMIEKDKLASMIFWGPPGVGKTTLALLLANHVKADFIQLSAVTSGVKDVRAALDKARLNQTRLGKKTILFVDEIHRFNKAQQDSLLHSSEKGTIILIGATTENPSFEVISPLLSRSRVFVLNELSGSELRSIVRNALKNDKTLKNIKVSFEDLDFAISLSGGDARKLLNAVELAINLALKENETEVHITSEIIKEAFQANYVKYDKNKEEHYNIISAFIKSIRGSDPDAAVYWMARMIAGGEKPEFIARRMIVLASEDIGNAEPYALTMAVSAFTAIRYIGMPEGSLVLAQTATFLASCPKSNASYLAVKSALDDVRNLPPFNVPLHLRNAPTGLMKDLGYGANYEYPHDEELHISSQLYMPDEIRDKTYYYPTKLGKEKDIQSL
jgi:putative ATPase